MSRASARIGLRQHKFIAASAPTYSVVQTKIDGTNAESSPGKDFTMDAPLTPGNLLLAVNFFQSHSAGNFKVGGVAGHGGGDGYGYTYLNRMEFDWIKIGTATATVHLDDAHNGFALGYGGVFLAELGLNRALTDVDALTIASGSSSSDKIAAGTNSGQIGPPTANPSALHCYAGYLQSNTYGSLAALAAQPGVLYAQVGPDGSSNTAIVYVPPTGTESLTQANLGNVSYVYHAVT